MILNNLKNLSYEKKPSNSTALTAPAEGKSWSLTIVDNTVEMPRDT